MMSISHRTVTRQERLAHGKALRKTTPREAHADFKPAKHRDPLAILTAGDATRIPELVPERYARMSVDAFAFLRGAAAVMAADLAGAPVAGAQVQACGDSHLMNFGAFATPENHIVFDVNDFDETLAGVDFTVDVKRLAASVAVAMIDGGASKKRARQVVAATVSAYRERMWKLVLLSPLEIWRARVDLEAEANALSNRALRAELRDIISKARGSLGRDDNFPRLVKGPELRIVDKPPTIFHFDDALDVRRSIVATHVFQSYAASLTPERARLFRRYELKDLAFRAVGVGSVGTFCCVGLFASGDAEPMFLQLKEASRSALEALAPGAAYDGHQGRRVVEGQRMMQAASDIFLGWADDVASGRQFYLRQLKNRRLGSVSDVSEGEALADYATLCGRTLAHAHARSGEPAVIAGYMGKGGAFDAALADFALAYAKVTASDHALLIKAKKRPTGEAAAEAREASTASG